MKTKRPYEEIGKRRNSWMTLAQLKRFIMFLSGVQLGTGPLPISSFIDKTTLFSTLTQSGRLCGEKTHPDHLSCPVHPTANCPKKKGTSPEIHTVNFMETVILLLFLFLLAHLIDLTLILSFAFNVTCTVHHYNYYANGWNASSYPKPRMSTEYGFQALPSVHSWTAVTDPANDNDWSFNGALLSNRQHHPLGNFEMELQVSSRLGLPRNATTRQMLLDMMYLTQVLHFHVKSRYLQAIELPCWWNRCTKRRPSKQRRSTIAEIATNWRIMVLA